MSISRRFYDKTSWNFMYFKRNCPNSFCVYVCMCESPCVPLGEYVCVRLWALKYIFFNRSLTPI